MLALAGLLAGCAGTQTLDVRLNRPPRVSGGFHRVRVDSRFTGTLPDLDLNHEIRNYLLNEFAEQGDLPPAGEEPAGDPASDERSGILAVVVEGRFGSTMGLSPEDSFTAPTGLEPRRSRTRHWYLEGHFELWDASCAELLYTEAFAESSVKGEGEVPALFGLYDVLDRLSPRILGAAAGGEDGERRRLILR